MPVQTQHRFTVAGYYRMAETGLLPPDARVELLDGKIIDLPPIGPFHSGVVGRLTRFFGNVCQGRWLMWPQNPLRLDDYSEPEPDFMLLKPSPHDYTGAHPLAADVFLLIEVSDTTLEYDRGEKLAAYGRAGIAEVWLVNLNEETIEVYREPNFTGYGSKTVLRGGDEATPQAFPDAAIKVAELLKR
jgi:Uma2 family endonuclease